MGRCEGCERLNKKSGECRVFKWRPKKCWAYTTEKYWLAKVKQEVEEYRRLKEK